MKNTKIRYQRLFIFLSFAVLLACSQSKEANKDFLPIARGEANVILVVMDTSMWDGPVGQSLKTVFSEYVPGLPQDEPYFKIRNINPLKLNQVLKTASNMIFVTTLDNGSRQGRAMRQYFTSESLKKINTDTAIFSRVQKDNWARGQEVLHLFGQSKVQLAEKIVAHKARLRGRFAKLEKGRLEKALFKVREKNIENRLADDHGFQFKIPYGYDLAKNKKDFVWMRLLDTEIEKNVFVYFKPYDSKDPFEDVMAYREMITSTYMRDIQKPEIYMTLQGAEYQQTKEVNFNGKYAKEYRGLWKLSDISGGGPFLSYLFVDESQKRIYYLEGYVYAPSKDKRVLMQEIESILASFKSGSELVN